MIRIHALDDNSNELFVLGQHVKQYNQLSTDEPVELVPFNSADKFIKALDSTVNIALLDIDLKDKVDGFDVARKVAEIAPKATIIMMSGFIPEDEEYDSFVPKHHIKNIVSEIVNRFAHIKGDRFTNLFEVFHGQEHYGISHV